MELSESAALVLTVGMPAALCFGLWLGHDATKRFHMRLEKFTGGRPNCITQWYAHEGAVGGRSVTHIREASQ